MNIPLSPIAKKQSPDVIINTQRKTLQTNRSSSRLEKIKNYDQFRKQSIKNLHEHLPNHEAIGHNQTKLLTSNNTNVNPSGISRRSSLSKLAKLDEKEDKLYVKKMSNPVINQKKNIENIKTDRKSIKDSISDQNLILKSQKHIKEENATSIIPSFDMRKSTQPTLRPSKSALL